jgi:hypothetical protein
MGMAGRNGPGILLLGRVTGLLRMVVGVVVCGWIEHGRHEVSINRRPFARFGCQ